MIETLVEADDIVQISCLAEALPGLWATDGVVPVLVSGRLTSQRYKHTLVEAVISRRCSAIGRTPAGSASVISGRTYVDGSVSR